MAKREALRRQPMGRTRVAAIFEALVAAELNALSMPSSPWAPFGARGESRECTYPSSSNKDHINSIKESKSESTSARERESAGGDKKGGVHPPANKVGARSADATPGFRACSECRSLQPEFARVCGICEIEISETPIVAAVARSEERQKELTEECNERIRRKERERARVGGAKKRPMMLRTSQGIGVRRRVDLHHTPTKKWT